MKQTDHAKTLMRGAFPHGAKWQTLLLALTLLLLKGTAIACQTCLPYPTESLADRVLAADHLVLARENPDRPFTLSITRTLEGTSTEPLGVYLDSTSRRWLSLDEERSILCVWIAEDMQWRRLARYEPSIAQVVGDILEHREQWSNDPSARIRYFADYLGHENTTLSDLAHLEVARAPYEELIQFSDRLSREQLREKLGIPLRIEWQGLYILLLGQSEHPDDRQMIREKVERNARLPFSHHTAAWATALIEVDGVAGIERLRALYLQNGDRSKQDISAIHHALRLHAMGTQLDLQDAVVAAYADILEHYPAAAPALAADLTLWERFDHVAAFARLLEQKTTGPIATAHIQRYLRAAERSQLAAKLK